MGRVAQYVRGKTSICFGIGGATRRSEIGNCVVGNGCDLGMGRCVSAMGLGRREKKKEEKRGTCAGGGGRPTDWEGGTCTVEKEEYVSVGGCVGDVVAGWVAIRDGWEGKRRCIRSGFGG